jgi:prepilin-type N-terminal cleavage/methylation domain-containing protein
MQTYFKQKNKGFTLLETLVAIALLSLSVGAAMGIAQRSLFSANLTKNQATATYLAAEGLELVRNIRDTQAIDVSKNPTHDWLLPFKTACNISSDALGYLSLTPDNCSFDVDPVSVNTFPTIITTSNLNTSYCINADSAKGCPLYEQDSTNAVNKSTIYSANRPTSNPAPFIFYRKITIQEISDRTIGPETGTGGNTSAVGKKDAVVTVTVSWLDQSYVLQETLTNW